MSIVVLQKKSRKYKAPISGIDNVGFSLNGTLRNRGVVGPINLGKSYIRTPFRGIDPVGFGGSGTKYNRNNIHNGNLPPPNSKEWCVGCCNINGQPIIKKSTMNTKGLLQQCKKFKCPEKIHDSNSLFYPYWVVKCLSNDSQGEYIHKLHAKYGSCISENDKRKNYDLSGNSISSNSCPVSKKNFIGTKRITNNCNIVKPGQSSVDMNTYLQTLIYKYNCLPNLVSYNNQYLQIEKNPLNAQLPNPPWINNNGSTC